MPTLILQFEDRVLKECPIGLMTTIGRLPDNNIIIENPAVSSHHACVFRDGERFVVEDLGSTNGTFVNEKRVTRHQLADGDVLIVGKHKLVFDAVAGEEPVAEREVDAGISNLGDTVFLDTKKHKALLAQLTDVRAQAAAAKSDGAVTRVAAAASKVGVLRVLAGKSDRTEYKLEGRTSVIGKSNVALIRLHGWFKPDVAVAIARNGHGYVATPVAGKTLINSAPAAGRHDLKDGDVLLVSGLTLEFRTEAA